MEMSHLASQLKALELELSEDVLVHLVLILFQTNLVSSISVITDRGRNGLLMSSFILCSREREIEARQD